MRNSFLTGTAILLLSAGAAFAYGGSTTNTTTNVTASIPVQNSSAGGSGTNSSATSCSTAISASLANSANESSSKTLSNVGNTSVSNSGNTAVSDSGNKLTSTDVLKVIGSNYAADGSTLETVKSDTKTYVTFATASTDGTVSDNLVVTKPIKSSLDADASMSNVNGGTGILTAQQNTGANAEQQSSVALGSEISGNNNFVP